MSRKTRSGFRDMMAAAALRPSSHSATTWTSDSSAMKVFSRARAAASSSAISTDSMPTLPWFEDAMTAQHDESAESEKRLRYESSAIWDEAKDPSGSGRWASPIVWAGGDE